MNDLTFLVLGLGVGAAYAAVAMGLVVIHNGTGVLNVAQAAIAMWAAFVFDEIRSTGQWILPIGRVPVGHALPTAILLGVVSAAAVGLITHAVVFKPLHHAPPLAKLVASVGVMLTLQALVVLRFGSRPRVASPVLPSRPVQLGSVSFSSHVVWLAALAMVVAIGLWAGLRFTRLGLAVRASAQNELGVSLSGFSPAALGALTWGVAAAATGALAILAASSTGLNPTAYSLLVVPALAAALAARLESPIVACVAALALGSVQAELINLSSRAWWPGWAAAGVSDVVPFILIVAMLFLSGHRLPLRGTQLSHRFPQVRRAAGRPGSGWAALGAGVVALALTSGSYRFGLITSLSVTVVALSLVLLTGLVGQVSLAQAAFAGVAGFVLSPLTHHFGVPFPWSLVLAAACSGIVGLLVGLPALRIRGMQLAVVTLAGAVAVEQFVFRNPQLTPPGGHPISEPSLFGLDVAVRRGSHLARLPFGLVVLGVVVLVAVGVGRLTRGDTGRTFLAVRANESAAAATGVDVGRAKLAAFALASFVAGVGGSLIGYSRGQLSADSFTALTGLSFLAWAYVGGITSVAGALVAGLFAPLGIVYVLVDRVLGWGRYYSLLTGLALVTTSVLNPDGLVGAARRLRGWASGRRLGERLRLGAAPWDAGPVRLAASGDAVAGAPVRASGRPSGGEPAIAGARAGPTAPSATARLEVRELSVRRGGVRAVDNVSLTVEGGRVVGLIGPNGAGKSSVVDAITGFVPARGEVVLDGVALSGVPAHRRARVGLARTWQSQELFDDLCVAENVEVACREFGPVAIVRDLTGLGGGDASEGVAWALAAVGLAGQGLCPPGELSFGQQRLVGLARALGRRPRVALLDEPAAGLGGGEVWALARLVRELAAAGVGVLLVDHDMRLVQRACDEVYVMESGRVIARGTPAEIRRDPTVISAYLGTADEEWNA